MRPIDVSGVPKIRDIYVGEPGTTCSTIRRRRHVEHRWSAFDGRLTDPAAQTLSCTASGAPISAMVRGSPCRSSLASLRGGHGAVVPATRLDRTAGVRPAPAPVGCPEHQLPSRSACDATMQRSPGMRHQPNRACRFIAAHRSATRAAGTFPPRAGDCSAIRRWTVVSILALLRRPAAPIPDDAGVNDRVAC